MIPKQRQRWTREVRGDPVPPQEGVAEWLASGIDETERADPGSVRR